MTHNQMHGNPSGKVRTAFVHYSAPPVVGGVEAVLESHAQVFVESGYPVTMVAGRGDPAYLPDAVGLVTVPEMDSQHPQILALSSELEQGRVPEGFASMRDQLVGALRPVLSQFDVVIIHNLLTKHFNLPLTSALATLQSEGALNRTIAWCHDFTWTSPHSRHLVFDEYPWDLLRRPLLGVQYVTISEARQRELAQLFAVPEKEIQVIYNGVDPLTWFGLSTEGWRLVQQMDLLSGDLIMIMPVRVTQAKNIEQALQVLAELKAHACRPRLVVTGPPDPHSEESLAYYRELLDLRGRLGLVQELRFVFESGNEPDAAGNQGHTISQRVVADLMRVSDVVFLPSHREGFGMPVLEAGLLGVPVVASRRIPAAVELGSKNVYLFNPQADPSYIAQLILEQAVNQPSSRFRRQVRQQLTWDRIFHNQILPLLQIDG